MKNKPRSAASKPIPKIEQSLGYKLGQMYKKTQLPGGRPDMAWDFAKSQGENPQSSSLPTVGKEVFKESGRE